MQCKKNIVSFSGGKDSTAMLLMMIEKEIQVDEIIFCDTGKEFPQMYEHIKKVEKYIGEKITVLKHEKGFNYVFAHYQRLKRNGDIQIGKGWPDFQMRWCTGDLKRDVMKKYLKGISHVLCQGIAFDEIKRTKKNIDGREIIYPLVEWEITEKQALSYCYSKGFKWGGLYEKFTRVSCYLCPLQSLKELYVLWKEYRYLWKEIERLDKMSHRRFRSDYTVDQLNDKFAKMLYVEKTQRDVWGFLEEG